MSSKILIVDDEKDICYLISEILKDELYKTITTTNSEDAILLFDKHNPDLVILDVWLGNSKFDGIELLHKFKYISNSTPIIIISGHGTVDMAVNAIKSGAYDFLEKPFNSDKLLVTCKRALENSILKKENIYLKKIKDENLELIGKSEFINSLKKLFDKICNNNSRILISGPSGSGKKMIAHNIHNYSKRSKSIANIIDCTNNDDTYYDNLFNETITSSKSNIFLKSNKGTIILDQINYLPLKAQKKLLKFIENPSKIIFSNIDLDIKIISLTSANLENLIQKGLFLKDLYTRINVVPIVVPPISLRRTDIIPLCKYFINKFNKNKNINLSFSKEAITKLESYEWPGNVNQIANYIERLIILFKNHKLSNNLINIHDLPNDMGEIMVDNSYSQSNVLSLSLKDARENFEKEYLTSQIKRFDGNINEVSKFTGMERTALYRKLKSLKIYINNN